VAVAIADLCLFAYPMDFHKALGFCVNAPSYSKLMSAVKQELSTTTTNVVLDILKENKNNCKLLQQ
jgi:hypothetical protein